VSGTHTCCEIMYRIKQVRGYVGLSDGDWSILTLVGAGQMEVL
jgi:hypothetical protein